MLSHCRLPFVAGGSKSRKRDVILRATQQQIAARLTPSQYCAFTVVRTRFCKQ